jgi:methyl-accepting chemotaxis protein
MAAEFCRLAANFPAASSLPAPPAARNARAMLDIDALETSFDLLAPRGEELVATFYDRLFDRAPAVRPLFGTDVRRQRAMLLRALVLVRKSLRDLDALLPVLRDLGARHVAYGARPEHYPVVAEVLVESMAALAGPAWRARDTAAWGTALAAIATVMLEGAAQPVAA